MAAKGSFGTDTWCLEIGKISVVFNKIGKFIMFKEDLCFGKYMYRLVKELFFEFETVYVMNFVVFKFLSSKNIS
jgi:hypothetical protein